MQIIPLILFSSRLGLSLILLIEAYYKFVDMAGFVFQVQGFGLMPNFLATGYAYALAPLEVLAAIMLITGWHWRIGAWISTLILITVFLGFQWFNISTGLYDGFIVGLRGLLQDQHLWMAAVSMFIIALGPGMWAIKQRRKGSSISRTRGTAIFMR